jgi:branched-chain amino acid transport system ATP-binding protein
VLLLDEPSLGLAPTVVEDVARAILSFRKQGITVLLVEQNARVALAISDRGYVIENGRTVLSNTAALLKSDPKVVASYLGGAPTGDARHLQPHGGMMEKLDLSLNVLASGERP